MGLVNFGVPKKEAEFFKEELGLNVFVEGGTYQGATAKDMSSKFEKVYTIEKSDVMFSFAKENLKEITNVDILKGDTREYLHAIIKDNDNIIFWLDAHWSGGDTYGVEDECPLMEELRIIFEYDRNFVILIDDARYFLAPPPSPHNYQKWPTLSDILNEIPKNLDMVVFEDVIYLFPKKINDKFKSYLQNIITRKWNKKISFFQRFITKIGLIH